MIYVLIFITGICVGSFYNVVGLRLLKGESIVKPASHCPNCMTKIKWYDLIPIFSFTFLGGKCRYCKQKISYIYPAIELLTGLLFLFSFYKFGISYNFFASLIISSVLILIYITDFKELIILDSPLIIGSILIFCLKFCYFGYLDALKSLLWGIVLFGIVYLIKILGDKIFKKESLGGGDIKLSFFIGIILGVPYGLISIVVASFLAFPYALIMSLLKWGKELPFGPFLITGTLIVFYKMDFVKQILDYILFR